MSDCGDPEPRRVLGISAYFHDSAATLVVDGRVVAAAQEERFSRRKGEPGLPTQAVEYCLREAGIKPSEVDLAVFYETPALRFDRLLHTYAEVAPDGWRSAQRALPVWAGHRMSLVDELRSELQLGCRVMCVRHHESHAASAFFPSPFESSAIVVMDAVGEWATSSIGVGSGDGIELLEETRFPHSLGMLYSAFTHYTGFRVNSGEYKVMGLAPYGQPRFTETILDTVVELRADGSLCLDLSYFDFHRSGAMTSARFHDLFGGPPRHAETPITSRDMDLAASIQQVCELATLGTVRHAREVTGEANLVMAGGVALNCVANGRIRRESGFDAVWVQPAAGDSGGALGAALLGYHESSPCRRRKPIESDGQQGSFLGPGYTRRDIGLFLDGVGAHHVAVEEDELLDRVSSWLADGWAVGWFWGRMEFGPRALGARSIIADPRSPCAQSRVNQKVKFRESFRPFAPSVLQECAHEVFDVDRGYESPYMMFVEHLRPERRRAVPTSPVPVDDLSAQLAVARSDVPAVTHVDHSARVQTVDAERHGRYYRLLRRFHERTGCPVLLNTSFNVRGEPIVQNPLDAYGCFMATDLDGLVLGDHLLPKSEQPTSAVRDAHRAGRPITLD